MALQSETIAIPVTKGIDVNTEARLVKPPALLEATNSRFPRQGGATKRRGHVTYPVLGNTPRPIGVSIPGDATAWVFGAGYTKAYTQAAGTSFDSTNIIPDYPDNKYLYGAASRDTESLVWNGHLLYSYSPAQLAQSPPTMTQVAGNAVMPSLVATPIAKVQTGQLYPDYADNGVIKVVAWLDAANLVYYSVYDSVTGAIIVAPKLASAAGASYVTAYTIRVVSLGAWVHILLSDSGNGTLQLLTLNQATPTANFAQRSQGACASHFDIYKVDETQALIVKSNTPYVDTNWIGASGAPANNNLPSLNTIPIASPTIKTVSCSYNTHAGVIGICYGATVAGSSAAYFVGINATTGAFLNVLLQGAMAVPPLRVSIANKYYDSAGALFDCFWEIDTQGAGTAVISRMRVNSVSGVTGAQVTKWHQSLASRAFTVGNRTFIWSGHNTTLQSTWFLLDEALLPVGHMDFGVANAPTTTGRSFVCSANFISPGTQTVQEFGVAEIVLKDITKWQFALGYRIRVPATATTFGVFSEPSIKAVSVDFLPKLRSAQGGRCTYFAGAQVWSYDGAELTEAGFHVGPELATPTLVAGALTGTYSYRVDLCYKNAQNEEIRSLSILTNSVTPAAQGINLQIPTCITRRANAYFLIYRNAMAGGIPLTNWWLLNSRDPASATFYKNDQTVAYLTVVDAGAVSDAAIQKFELHPATSGDTYLQPVAAPACEVITAGHDRMWVAGGELTPGVVSPSRLFGAGEAPTFNPYLNITVDRGFEPITAIGFTGNIKVFFRANNAYVLDGDGPDNVSNGLWEAPRLALADIGAVSQDSLALITPGLLFQSAAGLRLMSASGNIDPTGVPVDTIAKGAVVRGAVVANSDQEVRWYCEDRVIVYSYLYDCWSTWSFGSVGAVRLPNGRVGVARADGTLWIETEGVWTDGPNAYTHRIRFPWLHGGNLGDFQRVRLIQGLGRFDGSTHNVHVDIYYDEREFREESFDWVMPDTISSNTDTWGAATWGAGVWGDTAAVAGGLHDRTWEWVRKPARQKCSVFSVAIDDNNTAGPGFVLTALGLALANKPGLNRTPERGGTESAR